jgi:type IX secretion system PorP/SprF family membrane protein
MLQMTKRLTVFSIILIIAGASLEGQEISWGPDYQTILQINPAFTGSEGDGNLRLAYLNFYPGNNYNLNSVYVSYDSYVSAAHGGAGFYLADDYLGGIINDLRGGLAYAYHFQAGRDMFISAGLSASCYYRGFNNSKIILPDQIDPLNGVSLPSGEQIAERGRAVFDLGTGIMLIRGRIIGGLSVIHLATPDLSGTGLESDRMKRRLNLNLSARFDIDQTREIFAIPLFYGELEGSNITAGIGSTIESNAFSLSTVFIANTSKSIDLQAGCSVKTGILILFYKYKFNITSETKSLPASLLHQAGIAISLNYVDKRKVIKTINFPKL